MIMIKTGKFVERLPGFVCAISRYAEIKNFRFRIGISARIEWKMNELNR